MIKQASGRVTLCSALAIATALVVGATPVAAQALLGTVNSAIGVGPIATAPGATSISVTSPQAVINWTATGPASAGVTIFSNPGSLTTFSSKGDFAILNRVAPGTAGNAIAISGDVTSLVNGKIGGTVYFYSPNGIVIGGEARIDVGSLGLTTLPIGDRRGVWMSDFGGDSPQVKFGTASNGASTIRTEAGSGRISSVGAGNYVALVAPRVEHRGTIGTDSGAALVAASAATITFNPTGLYDIVVSGGSSDENGVVVDGGRIERQSADRGYDHHAYLVAVPANQAMTMLVEGGARLGFDIAGAAAVEGNSVVLSAGRDVIDGASVGAPSRLADATLDHATIGSDLVMTASGTARLSSSSGATLLSGHATLSGNSGVTVLADQYALSIARSLAASGDNRGPDAVGGTILVGARHGQTLSIGRSARLTVDGVGVAGGSGTAGNGTGGRILVEAASGGTIDIGHDLEADADGRGRASAGAGGTGIGGTISVIATGGGSAIRVGGATHLDASASGGSAGQCLDCSIRGGDGTGGTVIVSGGGRGAETVANSLRFEGGLTLIAEGAGGHGDAAAGTGRGGIARITASDATVIEVRGKLEIRADGRGGDYLGTKGNGGGGRGSGGLVDLVADGGSIIVSRSALLDATAMGGTTYSATGQSGTGSGGAIVIGARNGGTLSVPSLRADASGDGGAALSFGARAGDGFGGAVALGASGGQSSLDVRGDVALLADGRGGTSACGECSGSGAGGHGTGGNVSATGSGAGGRILIGGNLALDANGRGSDGVGGAGGDGTGGEARLALADGARLTIGGGLSLSVRGDGGYHFTGGQAGQGVGGDAAIGLGAGALLSVGTNEALDGDHATILDSSGYGGAAGAVAGGSGGAGRGGWSHIDGTGGSAQFRGDVRLIAEGEGGAGEAGTGGAATGGRARLNADGAAFHLLADLTLASDAKGGSGRDGGAAGPRSIGDDSDAAILANRGGSVIVDGATLLSATAAGGHGQSDGSGGSAVAGHALIGAGDPFGGYGTITLGQLAVHADATGGAGDPDTPAATGGTASGGRVVLLANSNDAGSSRLVLGDAILSATAQGGAGGLGSDGGSGVGGAITALAIGGRAALVSGKLSADVSGLGGAGGHGTSGTTGIGGRGGDGGSGRGGSIMLGVGQGVTAPADGGGSRFGDIAAIATTRGGRGGDGGEGVTSGAGGNGGNAGGALIELVARGGSLTTGAVSISAESIGGDGGTGATRGRGGDAFSSDFRLIAHNSATQPAWRGSADLGAVGAALIATGGKGASPGRAIASGGALIDVVASDVNLASYDAVVGGRDSFDPAAQPDAIRLVDATLSVASGFRLATDKPLAVHLDRSSMTADSVTLKAPDFVDDASVGVPASLGTIAAGSFDLATDHDLWLDAHLASLATLSLIAPGLVRVGNLSAIRAASTIGIGAGTTIDTGSIATQSDVHLAAPGVIMTGAITSHNGSVRAHGGSAISTGAVRAAGGVLFDARGAITTGTLDAGRVNLFALGNIAIGDVTAREEVEVETGQALAAGNIKARQFEALVGSDFLATSLTATSAAFATVGGLMTIEGIWRAPLSRIASNDLAIGSHGGILGGQIDLRSTNATQLLVGDGLSGSGYALSDAEFGRLAGDRITISGRSDAGAAIDTLVGSLSLSGGGAGRAVTIATTDGIQPAGSLRVVGAVGGSGFGAGDALTLAAGRVEIDATSGGIALIGAGTAPGGVLTLAGQRVHVATAAILDQLALGPAFAGRDARLAIDAAGLRPGGVIRADKIVVALAGTDAVAPSAISGAPAAPYSVLVQNVGSKAVPAGFVASVLTIVSPSGAVPGAIDLNINGQLISAIGVLTGVAVRNTLIAGDVPTRFTASSLINGCALIGLCGRPRIRTRIQLLGLPGDDDELFGNEEAIEDNEEDGGEDSASAPIAPPIPLFNTRPLEQKGDTDEPVSGGGNPALSGNSLPEGGR